MTDKPVEITQAVAEILDAPPPPGEIIGVSGLSSDWMKRFNELGPKDRQNTILALTEEAKAVQTGLQIATTKVAAEGIQTLFEFLTGPLKRSKVLFDLAFEAVEKEMQMPADQVNRIYTPPEDGKQWPKKPGIRSGRGAGGKVKLLKRYKEAEALHIENIRACATELVKEANAGAQPVNAIQINNNPGTPADTRTPYQKAVDRAQQKAIPETDPEPEQ